MGAPRGCAHTGFGAGYPEGRPPPCALPLDLVAEVLRYCEVLRCRLRPCTVFYGLTTSTCILLGLAPDTEARRRRGVRLGIQIWPRRPKTRSSSSTRKGSRQLRATLSWMSGESRDLPHAAGAFDLFLGGLPQQTVASVDHRETPQQFDKMATADLYRDLLIAFLSRAHSSN